MSEVKFDNRFTMGNAITVAVLIVSLLYYFFGIEDKVNDNAKDLCSIEKKVVNLELKTIKNEAAFNEWTDEIKKIKSSQKSILELNRLIADKMGIVYVIDVGED